MDPNKSDVIDDIPAKILKQFASELANPIADVINASLVQGKWPNIFKLEIVTPVPKEFPPENVEQLRNISGLVNLDKVSEKIIAKLIISDMREKLDPSQFANQKGWSIQHYLMKMLYRIPKALNNNSKGESCAVLATMVDWKQAFPRQCPKLGVESFVRNGVRPSLIPVLADYFQGRSMKVKWHGELSSARELNGGGPQGSTFGIWEYLSQSNDNCESVGESERFKFVDDLTFLEIIYLLNVGIATYNVKAHVPSDVPIHNQIIMPENLETPKHLEKINNWTKGMKMQLNGKKTKSIIFNFSKKNQFTSNLSVNIVKLEIVNEVKLLGTYITSYLKWNKNTKVIVKKAYARMQLLNKSANFTNNRYDLRSIYLTFIRSILEQSVVVWHSSQEKKRPGKSTEVEEYKKSSIPYMVNLLNEEIENNKNNMKEE